jgi:hypothetical protein
MALQPNDSDDLLELTRQIGELRKAGKFADAVPLAERLARVVETPGIPEVPEVAEALVELAELLISFDRSVEAELLLQRALGILMRQPGGEVALRERYSHIDTSRLVQSVPELRSLLADVRRRGARMFSLDPTVDAAPRSPLPSHRVVEDSYEEEEEEEAATPSALRAPRERRKTAKPQPPSQSPPAAPAPSHGRTEINPNVILEAERRAETAPDRSDAGVMLSSIPSAHERLEAERVELGALAWQRLEPSTPEGALAIEAGRLAYQIPTRMWVGVQETVEVRLGAVIAKEIMEGFVGRGDVKLEHVPIVETMSVSLACQPGTFDIDALSKETQLVKPDLVKGTAFHQQDFARWIWVVTPRLSGKHTLFVKVSAAIKDSRGLPTTSSLPDKIIAVTVRVDLVRATTTAFWRVAPGLAWAVATTLVGIFTKDYWWPYVKDTVWPAVAAFAGL